MAQANRVANRVAVFNEILPSSMMALANRVAVPGVRIGFPGYMLALANRVAVAVIEVSAIA